MLVSFGCSANQNPVIVNETPFTGVSDLDRPVGLTGIMGVYDVTVNTKDLTAELTPKRANSIGESWLVSGTAFFDVAPCANCLKLSGIELKNENISLTFTVRHPFEKGDTGQAPWTTNRLDLDVFDLAAMIHPLNVSVHRWDIALEEAYDDFVENADGYNQDLFFVLTNEYSNLPFVMVIDENEMDPIPSPTTWNRFEMGSSADFEVVLQIDPGEVLEFDMYLTMGYGSSAYKSGRLNPKYYNPEFNRKPAWKVVVTPPEGTDPPAQGNTWDDQDSLTEYMVKVEVYDWQIGAIQTMETDMEFADPSEILEWSEVLRVRIEIEHMISSYAIVTDDDGTGTGMPGSPLVFNVPVRNENLVIPGEYYGLVCVEDERSVKDPFIMLGDYLIHTEDGINLTEHIIPSFWTYQTFKATVVSGL